MLPVQYKLCLSTIHLYQSPNRGIQCSSFHRFLVLAWGGYSTVMNRGCTVLHWGGSQNFFAAVLVSFPALVSLALRFPFMAVHQVFVFHLWRRVRVRLFVCQHPLNFLCST